MSIGRAKEKTEAEKAIAAALNHIESENRPADAWEKAHLAGALNSVFRGAYLLALTQAGLASVPDTERSRAPIYLDDDIAAMRLQQFRIALAAAEAEPVREFPHFGNWWEPRRS